jgi:predicted MPP superfamily phosphohydrolase
MEKRTILPGAHRVSLFLMTFFLVYGSTHAYAFVKARAALGFGTGTALWVVPLLAVLMCAPILTHLLERNGMEGAARVSAYVGYVWMGVLFLFISLNLLSDLVNLLLRAGAAVAGNGEGWGSPANGRKTFLFLACLSLALGAYAALEASRIDVVRVRIATDRLPPSAPRVRIAQITDVHLGIINRNGMARAIADRLRAEQPDILVSTGDFVDGQIGHIDGLSEIFRGIPAPRGKFAVLGNHEYYAGLPQSLSFHRHAGFTVLRGEVITVDNALRIAGVDDPTARAFGGPPEPSEAELLGGGPPKQFTVLLKHRPAADPASYGRLDLQLSGHTHHGQIFPFRLLTRLAYPLLGGDHPLPGGGTLHVSRGTGTWGPPMRFLAPPEITVVDIERAPAGEATRQPGTR